MKKQLFAAFLAIFAVNGILVAQSEGTKTGTWSGVIINGTCTPDEAFAEAAKCTDASATSGLLALYDDTIRQVYVLDPQDQAKGHIGDSVTVQGTLQGNSLHVDSLKMFAEVGLRPGQKAPDFSPQDQFGHTQTLETLRGAKGTVLLFYRSADWCPYGKGQLLQLQAAKKKI